MVDSFCTNLRIAKCSHRATMLRFRSLASHKNSLTICNFGWWEAFVIFFFGWCGGMLRFLPLRNAQNFLIH